MTPEQNLQVIQVCRRFLGMCSELQRELISKLADQYGVDYEEVRSQWEAAIKVEEFIEFRDAVKGPER